MENYFGPVTPLLLLAMIAGLVEFAKKFGLQGNGAILLSMSLGVGFGILFQIMEIYPGVFTTWARIILYGLIFGLSASGLYDVGMKLASRVGQAVTGEKT